MDARSLDRRALLQGRRVRQAFAKGTGVRREARSPVFKLDAPLRAKRNRRRSARLKEMTSRLDSRNKRDGKDFVCRRPFDDNLPGHNRAEHGPPQPRKCPH